MLHAALEAGIPHVHACGGNARCSTCRVLILSGEANLGPRDESESRLANRRELPENVRLACRARVLGPVTLRRLVKDDSDAELALGHAPGGLGREANVAVMFTDLRDFTPFVATSLPYDVVHLLNRYFRATGDAVLRNHGRIDLYIGDGMMALFDGGGKGDQAACRDAVRAGLEMLAALDELNVYLMRHFGSAWRMGIGVHFGAAVLGEIGHPRHTQRTALGDTVNIASRIESACKEARASFLISDSVYSRVAEEFELRGPLELSLKGQGGLFELHEVLAAKCRGDASLEERLQRALQEAIPRHLAPAFLRLAFHDAAAFDPATGAGGADGSIRLPEELSRPENTGLEEAVRRLTRVRELAPEVSFADLIALGGAAAVAACGGPMIHPPLGRIDAASPSSEGRLPPDDSGADGLKRRFRQMGLHTRDLVALSGAHTLGRAAGKPFTEDLFSFSNNYYRALMAGPPLSDPLLPTDRVLVEDPDCRAWVELYARDEAAFHHDFAEAYLRLTSVGQNGMPRQATGPTSEPDSDPGSRSRRSPDP